MGIRKLKGALNKYQKMKDDQRKAQLKARTMYDWLVVMQEEYLRIHDKPENFVIKESNLTMRKDALDFSIIYQSENTRSMNPVARKEIKLLLKNIEKQLESP